MFRTGASALTRLALALMFTSSAFASGDALASIIIVGDSADGEVDEPGITSFVGPIGRVGRGGTFARNHSVVYLFELPSLPGLVASASLDFNYLSLDARPVTYSTDLYGLGWIAGLPTIQGGWFEVRLRRGYKDGK